MQGHELSRVEGEVALVGVALALALLFALPLCLQPWGGDTSVFEYIGRGWLSGAWPYAGAHDNKPPGIFFVHALCSALFGSRMWGYRGLELLMLAAMGWMLGRSQQGGSLALRVAGAFWLCAAFYFTAFDYWRTGQVELWVALLSAAAWYQIRGDAPSPARQWSAGVLCGLAFMFKFTAGFIACGVLAALLRRTLHQGRSGARPYAAAVARFGAGGAAAVVALCLPFVASGNFGAMWQALVPFNHFYVSAVDWKDPEAPLWDFWLRHAGAFTLSAAALVALALHKARSHPRLRGQLAEVGALFAFALVSTLLQGKLLAYHWVVAVPFFVAAVLTAAEQVVASPSVRAITLMLLGIFGIAVTPLKALPVNAAWDWRPPPVASVWRASLDYALGTLAREQYFERFKYIYSLAEGDELGSIIAQAAKPRDTLCVHDAFLPTVYTLTGLRCPSRFFSDHLLRLIQAVPEPPADLAAWEEEHAQTLEHDPPRWVVLPARRSDLELWGHRYRLFASTAEMRVLQRLEAP